MGLGIYGEQGIEGIHSEFNLQAEHFDYVKKEEVRLCQIMINHHIATSPTLAGKPPKPKEQNLKQKGNEYICEICMISGHRNKRLYEIIHICTADVDESEE